MKNPFVACVADSCAQANRILERLKETEFPPHEISLLLADRQSLTLTRVEFDLGTSPPLSGDSQSANSFANWPGAMHAFVVPGVGPFLGIGPIHEQFLRVLPEGGRRIADVLAQAGIQKEEANRLEGRLRHGAILISVHVGSEHLARRVLEIFHQEQGENVISIPGVAWEWFPTQGGSGGVRGTESDSCSSGPRISGLFANLMEPATL